MSRPREQARRAARLLLGVLLEKVLRRHDPAARTRWLEGAQVARRDNSDVSYISGAVGWTRTR